jgi:hypothetical protein
MDDFERQLSDALSRKPAPAWLEAKVLAASRQRRGSTFLRWMIAMASALVIAAGIWNDHRDGVRAKAQLELALKITATRLANIQRTVRASTEEE